MTTIQSLRRLIGIRSVVPNFLRSESAPGTAHLGAVSVVVVAVGVFFLPAAALAIQVPNEATSAPTQLTESSALLHGRVEPITKEEVVSCRFEYLAEAAYQANLSAGHEAYAGAQTPGCSPAPPYSANTNVSAAVSGLLPSTTYHFRLAAANSTSQTVSVDRTFTTEGPPLILKQRAEAVVHKLTVYGLVNPRGLASSCEIEVVDDKSFVASGYSTASRAQCEPGELPASDEPQRVEATFSGLLIATTYHYRIVVEDERGRVGEGPDQTVATFGLESFSFTDREANGDPSTLAGGHPYEWQTKFAINSSLAPVASKVGAGEAEEDPFGFERGMFLLPAANLRSVVAELPPGLIGDPSVVPTCTRTEVAEATCAGASQVGLLHVETSGNENLFVGLYNVTPPPGVPAEIGGEAAGLVRIYIDANVRTGGDYGITAESLSTSQEDGITEVGLTLWGVPSSPVHDTLDRFCPVPGQRGVVRTGTEQEPCPANDPDPKPFLSNPTACAGPLSARLRVDSWQAPDEYAGASSELPAVTGCEGLQFEPTLQARPTTNVADSPSGLHVDLHIPQNRDPAGRATAQLRDTVVDLPAGLAVNPSAANGLEACTPAQIGLTSAPGIAPATYTPSPDNCPPQARIGTVEVDTPLIGHPLPGSVYIASPHENPFGSLLAIYITVKDPESGVVVKLAGHVNPDPQTGQLTTTVEDSPQVPFEDFKLDFFNGAKAALRTPATCGAYETTSTLTPWSAPESGPPATPSDHYEISKGPNGGPCARAASQQPNQPSFEAGTEAPLAGAYSPFVLRLARADGSQELKGLNVALPPGLVGKLAGVAECSDAQLAAAAQHSGAAEQHSPSCPLASEVGTVNVGAGAGPAPYYVTGRAYLAGPYKSAPLSLAIVTPAVAGPFDLGTVLVRTALYVNPETAQITAKSDPIPTILQGIPLDVRSIALNMSRNQFTLNPTSCEKKSITGEALSALGQSAALSNPFQVGGCKNLGFHPDLKLSLKGATKRSKHPALTATLTYPKGAYANIASASVALPHSEFLEQAHIKTICTRVQFAEGNTPGEKCPAGSIYGKAKAITPLLDKPLEGPVYLRSSSHPLPDLVAALNGQIQVVLDGTIDSVNGGIRNRFEVVPDAPVSKFTLSMQGGKKGLLVNSTNLCKSTNKAVAKFVAQNGKTFDAEPVVTNSCKKKAAKHHKHHHRGKR